jgi:hypothetical protein
MTSQEYTDLQHFAWNHKTFCQFLNAVEETSPLQMTESSNLVWYINVEEESPGTCTILA